MRHQLKCRISKSLLDTLKAEVERTGHSLSHVVGDALSSALGMEHHSLFQVSTSGALVQGVYQGCMTVSDLKSHGDFGLGTYDGLDGELIMLDGHCYQAGADGVIAEAEDNWFVPFATITRFAADQSAEISSITSFEAMKNSLDALRPSENIFAGIRIDGVFEKIDLRAACKAEPGEDLVAATSYQSEFSFEDIAGTLVGFWTPTFAKTLNVAGYHLHFISADRKKGGHVLDVTAKQLSASLHFETDFHIAIPETKSFLEADLQGDPSTALDIAETGSARHR
ncbi:MAG: acetolactate decarboxylase [Sneathiella sp.]|nr:MAG: acetolactate decarboxylase [Sneathiella sp.]